MFRIAQTLVIVALVSQLAVAEQRRPGPSSGASAALDSLGMTQPESIRSILLLYMGRTLSKAKASELEADLVKTPDKIDERITLIGYYEYNGQTAMDRLHLRQQVLWLIENHPEHPATGDPSLRDLAGDPEGTAQVLALWLKTLGAHSDDLPVLKNAEKFFFGNDPAEAEQIIRHLSAREPNNREWPNELAELYRLCGVPGFNPTGDRSEALEGYMRVLEITRDATARQLLAGNMADTAFKAGDFAGAGQLAKIQLTSSDRSAVQRANTLLGRVALRSGDVAGGKQYLLDSAKPEAAKYVFGYGPTMVLAKELLEKGERDVVLKYLECCLTIWPTGETLLNTWIDDIKNGRKPDFGNLGR